MRLLGLDVGSKTVGVAISDELGITAQKLETIQIDETKYNFGMRPLKKLVRQYDVDGFVLGLPKNMDGTSGNSVARSKAYGKRLEEKFNLPVYYSDERLTTIESRRVLIEDAGMHDRKKRKQVIDQMAAVLIDDQGNEELYEVLFTFHSDDYDKSYVLLYPAAVGDDEDIEVQAFSYDADDTGDVTSSDLHEIESDDEWNMVQGVLNTFLDDDRLSGK